MTPEEIAEKRVAPFWEERVQGWLVRVGGGYLGSDADREHWSHDAASWVSNLIRQTVASAIREALSVGLPGLPLSSERLEGIRERAADATSGPWYAHHTDDAMFMNCYTVTLSRDEPNTEATDFRGDEVIAGTLVQSETRIGTEDGKWLENSVFIANARTDIPALLGHLDYLEGLIRDLGSDGHLEHYQRGYADGLKAAREG